MPWHWRVRSVLRRYLAPPDDNRYDPLWYFCKSYRQISGHWDLIATNLAFHQDLSRRQRGQLIQSLLDSHLQISPGLSQMTGDQISQHDCERMATSIPFNVHVPRPHLQVNRLARPESLFNQRQILVAIMYGLSIGMLLGQVAIDRAATIQPRCPSQRLGILLQSQFAIDGGHLLPTIQLELDGFRRHFSLGNVHLRPRVFRQIVVPFPQEPGHG